MPNYRRARVPGGTLFFTVNLLERRETLLVDHVDKLRGAIADTRRDYPFEIDAIVVRLCRMAMTQNGMADYAALIRPTGCRLVSHHQVTGGR
jgi:putative transposase